VGNRKSKKTDMFKVSVNSLGNPWSQPGRKGKLRSEGLAEKDVLKPGIKE